MRGVAVVGVGQTGYQTNFDETYPELVYRAARLTLDDARCRLADVDAVVIPMAPEALSGVVQADQWVVDAAAAIGKPYMRINTGGSTGLMAVEAAYWHIASGLADRVLVVGADKVRESGSAQQVLNMIWDPFYERAMPLNTITMLAFQAVRFMEKYGVGEEEMARVAVKNRLNGTRNSMAHLREAVTLNEVLASRRISWPIKLYDCCPQSSGGAGVLLVAEECLQQDSPRPAWITGLGCSAETYWMGDRMGPAAIGDHGEAPALAESSQRAYQMAGIANPAEEIDVAELYAPFSNTELHAIPDAGFCAPDEVASLLWRGDFDFGGRIPVNPSGGVMCANPISVTALIRVAEVALQLQDRAGDHQVPDVRTGVATGNGGDHQFFGTVVLSNEQKEPKI